MTRDEMDVLIDRHFRAEEAADVDAAIADFKEGVEHELAGEHRASTIDGARHFYAGLFSTIRLKRISTRRRLYGDSFAVDEAEVDAETVAGEPVPFRLLHIFEFDGGGIARESAWRAPVDRLHG